MASSLVDIPADLDAVTAHDPSREAAPADAGLTRAGVDAIWGAARGFYGSRTQPALSLCVRRHGKVIIDRAIGHSHGNSPGAPADAPKRVISLDTPYCIFSASKALTAGVIHLLDERNMLRLDDPVCEYIPGFERNGKRWVTIRHVLTHRAGLPTVAGSGDLLELVLDRERVMELLSAARPSLPPGRRLAYHAVTGGFILGEVARRVSGKPIEALLDEEIARPLGCRYLRFGVREDELDDVAVNAFTGHPVPFPFTRIIRRALGIPMDAAVRASNDPRFLRAVIPAGNGMATADDLCRYFQMLLDGGEFGGKRIISRQAVRRARVESAFFEMDLTLGFPVRYGLGFQLGARRFSMFGPNTRRAFGHYGFINIVGWADPERDVAGALLTSGKPIIANHLPHLYRVLSAVSKHCPRIS